MSLVIPKNGDINQGPDPSNYQPWDRKDSIIQKWQTLLGPTGQSLGKNAKGWDIVYFTLGNPVGGTVMVDAHLHGNEFYGHQLLYSLINWVLTSGDPNAKRILGKNKLIIIPNVNYRWGRTNYYVPGFMTAKDPGDKKICGINLNRNFSPTWQSGLSDNNDDNNSGSAPDSELESKALIWAWNVIKPRIYWNLHQGTGPSTSARATSTQAVADLSKVKSLNVTIATQYNIAPYNITTSNGGSGFAQDGAAKAGVLGIMSEVMSGWDSAANKKTALSSGENFQRFRAMFVAMCQAVESDDTPPVPPIDPCQQYKDEIVRLNKIIADAQADLNRAVQA